MSVRWRLFCQEERIQRQQRRGIWQCIELEIIVDSASSNQVQMVNLLN